MKDITNDYVSPNRAVTRILEESKGIGIPVIPMDEKERLEWEKEKKKMKKSFVEMYWQLFATALAQVTFVAMNTVFISKGYIICMLLTGFMISLIWTLNVKRVAFGGWTDRFVYAAGAMCGTGIGYLIAINIIKHI